MADAIATAANWWTQAVHGEVDATEPPADWWEHAKRSSEPCATERPWIGGDQEIMNHAALLQRLTVVVARTWAATPFVWEASLKGIGCDCRGLLTGVARELGRPEAETIEANLVGYSRRIDETALLAGLDRLFVRKSDPQPGDVLAFRIRDKVQHLGICTGDRFVHAYSLPPRQVIETPLSGLWLNRLAGVWSWR